MAQKQEEQTPRGSRDTAKAPIPAKHHRQGIWTKAKVTKLIGLYEKFPVLWNTTDASHFNENSRKTAIKVIAMGMQGEFDEAMLEQKIKAIRDNFAKEVEKEETSQRAPLRYRYKSRWEYYNACSFLRSTLLRRDPRRNACTSRSAGGRAVFSPHRAHKPQPSATTMAISDSGPAASEPGSRATDTRRQEDNDVVFSGEVASQPLQTHTIKQEVEQPPASPTPNPDHVAPTLQRSPPEKRPYVSEIRKEARGEALEARTPEPRSTDDPVTNVTAAPLPVDGYLQGSHSSQPYTNCSCSWAPAHPENSLLPPPQPPVLPNQNPATWLPGHTSAKPQRSPSAGRHCLQCPPPQVDDAEVGAGMGAYDTGARQPVAPTMAGSHSVLPVTRPGSGHNRLVGLDDDVSVQEVSRFTLGLLRSVKREEAKEAADEALKAGVFDASSRDNPTPSASSVPLPIGGQLGGTQNYQRSADGSWPSTMAYEEDSVMQPSSCRRPASRLPHHMTSTPQYSPPRAASREEVEAARGERVGSEDPEIAVPRARNNVTQSTPVRPASLPVGAHLEGSQNSRLSAKRSQPLTTAPQGHPLLQSTAFLYQRGDTLFPGPATTTPQCCPPGKRPRLSTALEYRPQVDYSHAGPAPASWVACHTGSRQTIATTTAHCPCGSTATEPGGPAWPTSIGSRPVISPQEDDAALIRPMAPQQRTTRRDHAESLQRLFEEPPRGCAHVTAGSPGSTVSFASVRCTPTMAGRPSQTASMNAFGPLHNAPSQRGADTDVRSPPDLSQLTVGETLVCQLIIWAMRSMEMREMELTIARLVAALFNISQN